MQEALKKLASNTAEPVERTVTLCIRSQLFHLNGMWTWEMSSAAVYCSDVISFPDEFVGTKGIVHPDDLVKLMGALTLMEEKEVPRLDFRIITTYGEVKTITGQRVSIEEDKNRLAEPLPGREAWEEALQQLATQRENDFLQLRKELSEYTERLHGIGSWLVNRQSGQTWYSDNVFRIYGLAPQTLNAHANTFNQFIHKDDRFAVLDAFEKAYAEQVPVHIEYRIVLAEGGVRHIQQITKWFYSASGQEILCGIVRDVTEERAIANELLAAQSQTLLYQQVLKMSEDNSCYWMVDLAMRKASFSENYFHIYGFKRPSVPSYNSFLSLVDPEDRDRVREITEKMYSEHRLPETEFSIIRPDGKRRFIKQSGKLFVSPNQGLIMIGLVQDVSVQKGLEKKILELNENITLNKAITDLAEDVAEVSFFLWMPGGHMQWSNGFFRLLGYKPGGVEPMWRFLYKNIYPADLKTFRDAESLLLNQQHHDDIVIRLVSKAGTKRVRISFRQINYGKEAAIALVHDITRQTEFSEQFSTNQLFIELMKESVNDIILFTNTDNTITHWNKAAEEKTGIKKEEALYQNLFDVLPLLNEEAFLTHLRLAVRGTEAYSSRANNAYLKKAHDYRLWPLKSETGEVIGILHVVQDISKQLELQHQLNERLNFIESLVESSVDRIVVLDRFMNYLYWNKKAEEYYAIRKEKVLGKNILEIFPSFRNHPGYNEFRKVLNGQTVYLPAVLNEDTQEYFETYLIPVKDETSDVTAVLWIVHDLSREFELQKEKRQAEAKIKEQSHFLRRITETGPDMISVIELVTGDITFLNNEIFAAHGFDAEKMLANATEEKVKIIHTDDRLVLRNYFDSFANATDEDIFTAEYRAQTDSGEWRWFFVRGKVFQRDNEGNATHVLNVIENITARKIAEQEVLQLKDTLAQRAASKYENLFNRIDEGFCVVEVLFDVNDKAYDYRFLEANASFEEKTGLLNAVGKTMKELAPAHEQHWFDIYGKIAKTGQPARFENEAKALGHYYEVYAFRIDSPQDYHVAILFNDITERKKAEEALRESEEGFRSYVMAGSDIIYKMSADWQTMYQLEGKDFLNSTTNATSSWMDNYIPEHEKKKVQEAVTKAIRNKSMFELEHQVIDVQGKLAWVFSRALPRINDKGQVVEWIGAASNITARKGWEQQLKDFNEKLEQEVEERTREWMESKRLLQTVLDTSLIGICLHEAVYNEKDEVVDFRMRIVNKELQRLTGRTDLKDKLYSEEFPGIKKTGLFQAMVEAMQTGAPKTLEYPYYHDGFEKTFISTFAPSGNYLVATNLDITERKKAEQDSQKQLTLLRYTEYLSQSGTWEYEVATGDFRWSEGMYKLFGLPLQMKVRPEIYVDHAMEEDRSIAKKIVSLLKKKHDPFEEVLRIKRNGEIRTIRIKGSVITDDKRKAQKIIGVDVDVTNIKKTEEELKESRHWLEQTAKASPDSITVYDLQNNQPSYLNNCLADWVGIDAEDLVEMGLEGRLQLIHSDDRLNLLHSNEKTAAARDGEIVVMEYRILTKEGKTIWLRNRSKPFQRDASGKVTHILSILQNVTEEVELREELKRRTQYAESIIDASIDRIAVYDKELRIIAWNKRAEEMTGRKKQHVLGQKLFDVFPKVGQDEQLLKAHLDALEGSYVSLPAKKGIYTNVYYERFLIPLKNERKETYAVVSVMHDVSEMVKRNMELDELNESLEEKNAELELKNEEITSFAFVASHDMKEPLRKIHTFSDWLMEQEANQLSDRGKSLIEKINAAVLRMEILIDDILVLTKIHSDTRKQEDVNLNKVLKQVFDDMFETVILTQTGIQVDELPVIKGNSNQIFYLFKNLISNAIKFQKPGNVPQIKVTAEILPGEETNIANPGDEYAKISFIDNGFGFDQRYAKKIFQVFQRLHGKQEFEGTGIGLAICKKIMDNHEGIITVESEQGKGSVFSCYFPLH